MSSNKPDIKYLWLQFVQNKASWQELQALLQHLQENPDTNYDIELLEEYMAANPPEISAEDQQLWAGKLQQFWVTQGVVPISSRKRTLRFYTKWIAAACILSAAALITFYAIREQRPVTNTVQPIASANNKGPETLPGAILTLSDGRQITLDSIGNGMITQQDGTSIQLKDHQLIYSAKGKNLTAAFATNTLSTPRGRQYQVALPDGSRAWLNAASSLTYPTAFRSNSREVEVTGEVYFEVIKSTPAIPFIVKTPKQIIEVLGTQFNVNCYAEEAVEKTTLVEGRVRVKTSTTTGFILQPGEQAMLNSAGDAHVQKTNVPAVTDWKSGKFYFNNDNIHTIMRKISRLYDMEIVYQDAAATANKNFVGSVNRFDNVNELLRKLELTGTIKFRTEGRKILVMP